MYFKTKNKRDLRIPLVYISDVPSLFPQYLLSILKLCPTEVFSFNSVASASYTYLEERIVLTRKPQSFHVLVNVTCTTWGKGKIGYGRGRWTTGCLHHDVHCCYWKRWRNSRNCPIPTCWHRCWKMKSKIKLEQCFPTFVRPRPGK
jgi:hypothetical protein